MGGEVLNPHHWDRQYQADEPAWETERPATELVRCVQSGEISLCRLLDIGCGSGLNALWLARQGFEVTAIDLSEAAIDKARRRRDAGQAAVNFHVADLTKPGAVPGSFDAFIDCGSYSAIRTADANGYFATLRRLIPSGGRGLVLVGNAEEPEDEVGPPVMTEEEVRREWNRDFELVRLSRFRFDPRREGERQYLGWSCFVRRR